MGYEITFVFKEQTEPGVYAEEEKSRTIKVGTAEEELPLELVAAKIFAQLARRNILVVNVEIYEFTKKKLNYKETADGILIKNKKFKFDDGIGNSVEIPISEDSSDQVAKLLELLSNNPDLSNLLNKKEATLATKIKKEENKAPHEDIKKQKVLRHEIFDPPAFLLKEAKRRGLRFTVGNKYPILSEKLSENPAVGLNYTTINDLGERQILASIHFNPVPVKLEGNFVEGPIMPAVASVGKDPVLSWDGVVDDGMGAVPSLR